MASPPIRVAHLTTHHSRRFLKGGAQEVNIDDDLMGGVEGANRFFAQSIAVFPLLKHRPSPAVSSAHEPSYATHMDRGS